MNAKCLLTIGLTLCCGGVLSSAAAIAIWNIETIQQQQQFSQDIDRLTVSLQRTIDRHSEVLSSLSVFFNTSPNITEPQFQAFAQPYLDAFPGIQTLKWAPVISAAERAQYEAQARQRGDTPSQIVEATSDGALVEAALRDEYIPVTYIAPSTDKLMPRGLDLGADRSSRQVLHEARSSQTIAASAPIPLVQTPKDQLAILISLPTFAPITEQSPTRPGQDNMNMPAGFVIGVFRISSIVEDALIDVDLQIEFAIADLGTSADQQSLHIYRTNQSEGSTLRSHSADSRRSNPCMHLDLCERRLSVGHREWSIAFTPSPSHPLSPISPTAVFVLLSGLSTTAGLLAYLLRSQSTLERLQNTNDFKLRFFSMASQEMRPQLTTLRMCVKSLESNRDKLSPTQEELLINRMQTTTKELSQLSDDILTLVRVESGLLQFEPSLVDVHALCQELVAESQVRLKHPGIFYENLSDVGLAYLDPLLLRTLLVHLLSNAAKYSPDDSIVHLALEATDEQLELRVSDSGIGIPPHTLQKLFKSFVRGDNVGKIPGTGLGLRIAKTCVDLHHGTIAIDSEVDMGTLVTVKLPLV